MDRFFLTLLNMSLTASIAISVVMLVRLLLKRAPKVFSYILWVPVLFRLVCPVVMESTFGMIPVKQLTQIENIYLEDTSNAVVNHAEQESKNASPDYHNSNAGIDFLNENLNTNQNNSSADSNQKHVAAGQDSIEENQGSTIAGQNNFSDHAVSSASGQAAVQNQVLRIAETIWLMGVAVLLCYSLHSFFKVKRSVAGARSSSYQIYEKENLKTSFVLGIIRPHIYIPTGLGEEEREYILAHEKMHIHRLDHIIKLISFCVLLVHWMNPFVWISFILMTKDMEMSCDEAVIRKLGMGIKKKYSISLLNMATKKQYLAGTPLAFGEGSVKGRIKNVLRYKKAGIGMLILCMCIVTAVIALLITNSADSMQNNRIKMTKLGQTRVNGTDILQQYALDYDLNPEVKSYIVFASVWEDGKEVERNAVSTGGFSAEALKGEMNISIQYSNKGNEHQAILLTELDGNSQSITYDLNDYAMRAGNILWNHNKYYDIFLEEPYILAAEYIGGSDTARIETYDCKDMLAADESLWYLAKQQTKESGVTMILIYYVASEKSSEELQSELDRFPLTITEIADKDEYPSNLEQMYQWRAEYIGNNAAVGNITDTWFMDEEAPLQKNGLELHTTTEPYEVSVHYLSEETADRAYDANAVYLERDAALFFSLIHNAGNVNIKINNQTVANFHRDEMEENFGDLWLRSETYDEFCKLYDDIVDSQSTGVQEAVSNSAVSIFQVMDRMVEEIGIENALPYNNTADISKEGDTLIKLCSSQEGKYEAYGCISQEYGYRGIILNNIIDGEPNTNYLDDTWAYLEKQPALLILDDEQYQVLFTFFQNDNGMVVERKLYFDSFDTGTMSQQEKKPLFTTGMVSEAVFSTADLKK